MLIEEDQVIGKIGINYIPHYHSAKCVGDGLPLKLSFVPADYGGPYYGGNEQQREQAIGPDKREHQRQQPFVFPLEQQVDAGDGDNDRQRRRLCHVHSVVEHVGTGKDRREPDQRVSDLVAMDQPIDRKNSERRKNDGGHFGCCYGFKEPQERYLEQMEQEMVIVVM